MSRLTSVQGPDWLASSDQTDQRPVHEDETDQRQSEAQQVVKNVHVDDVVDDARSQLCSVPPRRSVGVMTDDLQLEKSGQ